MTRDLADAAVADHGMKVIQSNFPGNQLNGIFQGLHAVEEGNFDPPFMTDYPYTDVRVREAMNRAIDKETIMNTLFSGRVTISRPLVSTQACRAGISAGWTSTMNTMGTTLREPGNSSLKPGTPMGSRFAAF